LGLALTVVVFVGMSVLTSVNITGLLGLSASNVPKADQTVLNKAGASDAGQTLKRQGFTPKTIISDNGMIAWLDEQEKHQNITNPGPYVLFSTGVTQVAKPDPGTPPDVLVDATNGVMVALYQTYLNGRGLACYNTQDIRTLSSAWVPINVHFWDTNLATHRVTVTHVEVSQVLASLSPVSCYLFVP